MRKPSSISSTCKLSPVPCSEIIANDDQVIRKSALATESKDARHWLKTVLTSSRDSSSMATKGNTVSSDSSRDCGRLVC